MKDEYIIINKTAIRKEKEELKNLINKYVGYAEQEIYDKIDELFFQSTPLIPVIEQAFDAGNKRGWSGYPNTDNWTQPNKQDYISNLKLDI